MIGHDNPRLAVRNTFQGVTCNGNVNLDVGLFPSFATSSRCHDVNSELKQSSRRDYGRTHVGYSSLEQLLILEPALTGVTLHFCEEEVPTDTTVLIAASCFPGGILSTVRRACLLSSERCTRTVDHFLLLPSSTATCLALRRLHLFSRETNGS